MIVLCCAVMLGCMLTSGASAQEILLDKGLRVGPLQLFQDFNDPQTYYYVADKIRLSTGEDGKPQFSFLKFVSNVSSEPGAESLDEAEGGGIVHCVVQLGATEDQIQEARTELRRLVPGAKIAGPIIFRSGKFGLVSSFKQEDGDWTTQVLGIGNAPILEGEKAAVSIRLTKMGAKILWQSFQTAAPDISFTFEMEMSGYRNPYDATLIANWDQIYNHQDFAAALASSYVGFQIRDTFDKLQQSGGIQMIVKGDDTKMDALMATAYGKICELMFDKMETGHFAPDTSGPFDLIGKAGDYLKTQREQVRAENRETAGAAGNEQRAQSQVTAANYRPISESTRGGRQPATDLNSRQPTTTSSTTAGTQPSTTTQGGTQAQSQGSQSSQGTQGATQTAQSQGTQSSQGSQSSQRSSSTSSTSRSERKSEPSFSLLASYTMKKVKRSGEFKLNFKKYLSDSLQLRFDENIGNLSKLMKDKKHFFEVNLDDPVFKQREVAVYLDGQNAADFEKYVNFVTIRLRKKHQGGDFTNDEVRIDRENFNKSGNFFKLLYGWKNDANRDKWMDYEYDTVWSFHGGKEIDLGWTQGRASAVTVTPPLLKRTIHLEADPIAVQDAGVRLITVKFYYDVAGKEQMTQATLNPASGQLSQILEYIRPVTDLKYDYEIEWRLKGGDKINSGRKTATDDFIFCDELPARNSSSGTGGVI
jgi:hypothetical protein